jgi:hypothetical protein
MTEVSQSQAIKDPWLEMAAQADETSTTYVDTNYRKQWENNERHFQSKHATGSKYLKASYQYRSKIFRPKTRSAIRGKEAAAKAAFFANQDVLNIQPGNVKDPNQVASAKMHQVILGYRLSRTIPWYLICIGGFQDAQKSVVCSCQEWIYEEKVTKVPYENVNEEGMIVEEGETEEVEVITDQPSIRLLPVENLRISPAADWMDPINTSPYLIEHIPMYAKDVKARMEKEDPKTGEPKWKKLKDDEILSASKKRYDSTRMTREDGRTEKYDEEHAGELKLFDIVWVHRNFMMVDGEDYVYYTLGTEFMLSKPKPIEEVYFHGKRPYTMGFCAIETHKLYPSPPAQLGENLQKEINEIANQRLDNIKFVLNKRWFVKRGAQVDLKSITKNVSGSVTMANNPKEDIVPVDFSDVTGSAFHEQDRLNADHDELVGNFSQSSVQTGRKLNETVGGMNMMRQGANQITEYDLFTFSKTWVEPTLYQLVQLEQKYETDEVILALAAEEADLYQEYGIDQVTDDLLNQELTVRVNVGMGATDPIMKMRNLAMGIEIIIQVINNIPPGTPINVIEIAKEVFGFVGYEDGERFLIKELGEDPEKLQMSQMIEQLQAAVQELQQQIEVKQVEQEGKLRDTQMKEQGMDRRKAAELRAKLTEALIALQNPTAGEEVAGTQ